MIRGIIAPPNGRLMLAGFLLGIVHDRRLMREAQVNLAICWFIGYALHEALPDHSSLTRIRQRWGEDVFRRVFTRVVRQCQLAGLVSAETVHIDASLIRTNVSMDALVARHLDAVEAANDAERDARELAGFKTLCGTDPDASCHCCVIDSSSKGDGNVEGLGLRPACKQHIAVDDLEGIVVDVEIVTARNTTRAGSRSASTSSREPSGSPRAGSLPTRSAVWAASTPPLRTARSMPSFRLFAPPGVRVRKAFRPNGSGSILVTMWSAARRRSG